MKSLLAVVVVALLVVPPSGIAESAPSGGGQLEQDQSAGTVEVRALPPATADGSPAEVPIGLIPPASGKLPAVTSVDSSVPVSGDGALSVASPIVWVNQAGIDDTGLTPPDPQIAAGSSHVVEFVNSTGKVYSKPLMTEVQTFSLRSLFNLPAQYDFGPFDPRLLYDALSGRWIATATAFDNNPPPQNDYARLLLAVSNTSNPTGTWCTYYHPQTNYWSDIPWLGVSSDKITVTSNRWVFPGEPGGFLGEETRVYNKVQALACTPTILVTVFPTRTALAFTRPAQNMTSGNDQYAAKIDGSTLRVLKYAGNPQTGSITETITDVALPGHAGTADPPAPGGLLSTPADDEVGDAFVHGSALWIATTTSCIPPGDTATRNCAQIARVSTSSYSLLENIVYGSAGKYYFYPAARTTAGGDLIMSMARSSSTVYPEAIVAGRRSSDPPGSLSPSVVLATGSPTTTSGERWGDYLGAARDPSATGCVWTIGEYSRQGTNLWGTKIGELTYGTSC